MSTSKHVDKFCLAAVAVMLVLTILFMCGGSLGLTAAAKTVKYESTLFDTSYVHKIDIVMDDWDTFLETCENEEYASCTIVVDGKKQGNVAIRAKGNTSLSSVKSMGSPRYSFKLEFDHYQKGKSLDGLDKLCLNNLIQDNTMMKDYLAYRMMADFGADSPLCSFVYLTVNGEDWGLYLAVESIEDSFLARSYGSDTGELYKPDSMSFGGGRGNGRDFNFDDLDFDFGFGEEETQESPSQTESGQDNGSGGEGQESGSGGEGQESSSGGDGQQESGSGGEGGQGFPGGSFPGQPGGDSQQENGSGGEGGQGFPGGSFPGQPGGDSQQGGFPGGGGGFGGMGSDDVKLKYIDDDPDSYPNIFDNAKTDVSETDQERLIASLKQLSEYTDLEDVLDMDEVLRYFVVHVFTCNGDSYTGSMIHNYYLHEKDGKLSMIPWDYNLAFGTFQGGDASSQVNASIDSPVSGSLDDRPMVGWIFSDESYTEMYHALFAEFIERWFSDGQLEALIAETAEMLRPYVEKDPTKFCTTEEFEKGVTALTQFVSLRGEAVSRQLNGDSTAVETDGLNLSDMGSMGGGGSPGGDSQPGGFPGGEFPGQPNSGQENSSGGGSTQESSSGDDGQENSSGGSPSDPMDNTGSELPTPPTQSGDSSAEPGESGGASSGEQPQGSGDTPQPSGEQPQFPGQGQQSSGDMPRPSGEQPQVSGAAPQTTGDPAGSGSGNRPQPPKGFDPGGGTPAGSSEQRFWLLTGVSVLALAIGTVIAVKKKY